MQLNKNAFIQGKAHFLCPLKARKSGFEEQHIREGKNHTATRLPSLRGVTAARRGTVAGKVCVTHLGPHHVRTLREPLNLCRRRPRALG